MQIDLHGKRVLVTGGNFGSWRRDVAGYMTGTTVFVDGGMTDYANFMSGG